MAGRTANGSIRPHVVRAAARRGCATRRQHADSGPRPRSRSLGGWLATTRGTVVSSVRRRAARPPLASSRVAAARAHEARRPGRERRSILRVSSQHGTARNEPAPRRRHSLFPQANVPINFTSASLHARTSLARTYSSIPCRPSPPGPKMTVGMPACPRTRPRSISGFPSRPDRGLFTKGDSHVCALRSSAIVVCLFWSIAASAAEAAPQRYVVKASSPPAAGAGAESRSRDGARFVREDRSRDGARERMRCCVCSIA